MILLADMKKAFPRTWREALVDEASRDPAAEGRPGMPLRGGALVLVAEALRWEEVVIGVGATSLIVILLQGVPEGGVLGPWLYTKLPDILIRSLRQAGRGTQMGVPVPAAWAGCQWRMGGRVTQSRVEHLAALLAQGGAGLPSVAALEANKDLSADALEALDRNAAVQQATASALADPTAHRLPCLIHCDDPFFVAASLGGMRHVTAAIEEWSTGYKQEKHVTSKKSAMGFAGPVHLDKAEYEADPLTLRAVPGAVPTPLSFKDEKLWLGVLWRGDLDFGPQLRAQVRSAGLEMMKLAGLTAAGFPLPVAVSAFEGKVDSKLQHARWLHILVEGAEAMLDQQFKGWARQMLGLPRWASSAAVQLDLGWGLSGYARSLRAAAGRRAALWTDTGLAGHYFRRGHSSPGRTWAKASLQALEEWGIPDFPECEDPTGAKMSEEQYKTLVKKIVRTRCLERWQQSLQRRREPLPMMQYIQGPAAFHHELLHEGASWTELGHVRGWCRLRSQAVLLAEH